MVSPPVPFLARGTVVFYVGYCYNRLNQQFDDVQLIMHSICDACLAARVSFGDPDEVHRLWRYLNLLHASAYCGLTDELSASNFFMPIVDKFNLLGTGAVKEEEHEVLKRVDLDAHGSRACSMFEVWAFEVVKGEARRTARGDGDLTPPIQARLQGEINNVSISIQRLFAYRYQVMPYICESRRGGRTLVRFLPLLAPSRIRILFASRH